MMDEFVHNGMHKYSIFKAILPLLPSLLRNFSRESFNYENDALSTSIILYNGLFITREKPSDNSFKTHCIEYHGTYINNIFLIFSIFLIKFLVYPASISKIFLSYFYGFLTKSKTDYTSGKSENVRWTSSSRSIFGRYFQLKMILHRPVKIKLFLFCIMSHSLKRFFGHPECPYKPLKIHHLNRPKYKYQRVVYGPKPCSLRIFFRCHKFFTHLKKITSNLLLYFFFFFLHRL